MKKIENIDKKLEFLKMALEGGDIIIASTHPNNRKEYIDKAIDDNIKIQSEIDELKQRKEMIIRKQKIKKITDDKH